MPQRCKSPRKNAKHSLELAAGPILFYIIGFGCQGLASKKLLPDSKNLLQSIPEEIRGPNLKCIINAHY